MPKLSLLEVVQSTLSAMDSDPVNSISDTVESQQVATIAKECYYDLISQRDWPFLRTEFSLEGLADVTKPTHMRLGQEMSKIMWVKYNKNDVQFMEPHDFRNLIDSRVPLAGVVNSDGYGLTNDPSYYTTYDDEIFVFDSINQPTDATLYAQKSTCFGVKIPLWESIDSYIPFLPEKMFPMYLSEVKSQSFVNLKQSANPKEERKAQLGRNIMQNESWRNDASEAKWNSAINYGRK